MIIIPAKGIEDIRPAGRHAKRIPNSALFSENRSCKPGILDVNVEKIKPDKKKNTEIVILF